MSRRKVALLKWLAASVIPILAFIFIYPRQIELIILFIKFEFVTDYLTLLVASTTSVALILGGRFLLKRYPHPENPIATLTEWFRRSRWAVVFVLPMLAPAGAYFRLQYRVFSELYYQERALDAIQKRRMLQARLICQDYVRLYPPRAQMGVLPGEVCTAILEFTANASALRQYVLRQKANLRQVNGVVLPPAPPAREETLRILERFTTDADK